MTLQGYGLLRWARPHEHQPPCGFIMTFILFTDRRCLMNKPHFVMTLFLVAQRHCSQGSGLVGTTIPQIQLGGAIEVEA